MKKLDLNGTWKLRWCDGQRGAMPHYLHEPLEDAYLDIMNLPKDISDDYDDCKWIDATVPGEVHLDLMRAGIIENPYIGAGVLASRWVEECFWFYRRVFDAEEASCSYYVKLVLEGLDYAAVIYLNGKEIGRHENAFYPCKLDVSHCLKAKDNILLIRLESGLFSACERPIRSYYTATMTVDVLLHKRNWLRKVQSQAAWDWAPRLMNIGVFQPVYLEYSNSILVDSMAVTAGITDSLDQGCICTRLFVSKQRKEQKPISIKLTVNDQEFVYIFNQVPEDGVLVCETVIQQPTLWWPVGYGEPYLYTVQTELLINYQCVYAKSKQVGFRHVKVNQQPHPEQGRYFIFEINHIPVFMRGSNMVPLDMITAAITEDRYRTLVDLALEANFNFLRIWGGGQYEADGFYAYCDQKGIMVWQEFIAACAVIPADDESLKQSIREEAKYNIRRLSHHPSLIALCGNNEVGMGEFYGQRFHCGEDRAYYDELFPSLIKQENVDIYYQPTSPYSIDSSDYNSDITGDQHPWSVGFCNKDSRDYEKMVCRFPNEGGILGPSSFKTIQACLKSDEGMHSFSWAIHDNMLENWMPGSSPDEDVRFWLGLDVRKMPLEQYVYAGGFVQAEGLRRYIENFRRRKYDSSSAVFWMFNDCWPTTRSWTIVDYYLRKTPSYHAVRRAFSPVSVVVVQEENDIHIYGINDTLETVQGQLRFGAFRTNGQYVMDERIDVRLQANASTVLATIDKGIVQSAGKRETMAFACLLNEKGAEQSTSRYSALKYTELNLCKSDIHIQKVGNAYELSSKVYVMGVCLGIDGDEQVDDNMFDLFPGQIRRISCGTSVPTVRYCINDLLNH